ncbi:MAG: MFS transporter [Thaumarchaeota archaeon]|nr:MFS transporter [Nitrososphaerota archaeon]
MPPLIPIITASAGLSLTSLGLIATGASLMYGFGALAGGVLADRHGEGRVLVACMGLSGASALIVPLAPNEIGLAVGLLSVGLWGSFYHPTAISLISKVYYRRRASALGLHGALGHLGQVFTPVSAVGLAVAFGWPYAFMPFAFASIVFALPFMRVQRLEAESKAPLLKTFKESFRNSSLRALFAFSFLGGLSFQAISFIFPAYLVNVRGFSVQSAGVAGSVLLAFGVLGQFTGGRIVERLGGRLGLVYAASGALLGLVGLLVAPDSVLAAGLFVVLYGLCFYASQPASDSLIATLTNREIRGLVFGIIFSVGSGLGSFSAALAGRLSESFGAGSAVGAAAVFELAALLVILLVRVGRKDTPES